jgi:hypothetical protein
MARMMRTFGNGALLCGTGGGFSGMAIFLTRNPRGVEPEDGRETFAGLA